MKKDKSNNEPQTNELWGILSKIVGIEFEELLELEKLKVNHVEIITLDEMLKKLE